MLDPDRDEARELLERELARPEYHRPESLLLKGLRWLMDRLNALIDIIPGSTGLSAVLLALLITLVVLAGVFAVRGLRRTRQLTEPGSAPVLEEPGLSAADYRQRAAAAASRGDWDRLLLDSYRALVAASDERVLLDESPGRTAHEIAIALVRPFPHHATEVLWAAEVFDTVRYGARHASRQQAERVRDLDRQLARTRPERVLA